MRCQRCGTDNPSESKFCAECGAGLMRTCPRCGAETTPTAKFCSQCGESLDTGALNPLERASSEQTIAGERRHLTILFCDVVGSVTLTSRVDPEEWRTTVAGYQRAVTKAITRFGGEVVRYVGDGIMAFFGYPVAHDNDAERAARAGLAIVEAIAHHDEPLEKPKLAVRIGIDSGLVVVGTAAQAVDAYGDTANIAARVQALAEPGMVAVTAATHRLISGLFVVEDRGPEVLKGIEQPVQLYRVVRPSGMRNRFEAAVAAGGLTPFVGRDDELRSLLTRWERTREGNGQAVIIIGEAGIGKSRMVRRFQEAITGTPHTWLEAGAGVFFQNTPFYPVSETLRQFASESQDAITGLASRLEAAGLAPAETIPLLAPLLNLPLPVEYTPSMLPPDQQRRRLLAALVQWILGSAQAQPLISVIEDLHWADPSTLELIQLLVEQGSTAPLMLLYTARPEFRPPWPLRAHHTQMTLNRLSAQEVRTMVGEVAARKALSDETVATVVDRTGGVPLFVEELTRTVLDSGEDKLHGKAIPVSIQDSLMARLDRLGPAKEVLQIGSVLGSDFSYELLDAVIPQGASNLRDALAKLTDAELLYVRGIAPDASYQFKHALIRDAAYEALLKSRRKELHFIVARTIDQRFPTIRDTQPEVLARHWTEAGESQRAIVEWRKAGEHALLRSAYREAEQHYRNALGIVGLLPESPERECLELALQLTHGPTLIAVKGWASPETERAYTRAHELAQRAADPRDAVNALFGLWVNHLVRSHFHTAYEIGEQLLSLAKETNEPRLLLQAHQALGASLYQIGKFKAARGHLEATLSFCGDERLRSLGVDMEVVALSYLSRTLWFLGYPDQALKMNREAVAVGQKLRDPFSEVFGVQFLSVLHQLRGELEDFRNAVEQVIRICTEHGFAYWGAHATVNLGAALAEQGRGEEAFTVINKGFDDASATGADVNRVDFLRCLVEAYVATNRIDHALDTVSKALAVGREHEDLYLEADTLRLKGELLLRQDRSRFVEAEACFRKGLEIARDQSARSLEIRVTTSLARLLMSRAKRHEALDILAEIYNWFTEGFDTLDLREAKALLDELSS